MIIFTLILILLAIGGLALLYMNHQREIEELRVLAAIYKFEIDELISLCEEIVATTSKGIGISFAGTPALKKLEELKNLKIPITFDEEKEVRKAIMAYLTGELPEEIDTDEKEVS